MEAHRIVFLFFCTVYIGLAFLYNGVLASPALDVSCNSSCLLVATERQIVALDYNNATIYPIISNLSRAVAMDYHFRLGYIFWSDYQERNIKRSNINGTDIKILHNNTGRCYGLAVDWRSSQLYWTDSLYSTISVSDLDGNNNRVLRLYYDYPVGIVLDPERGLMFWTDYYYGVKKSTLNGTQIVTLVNHIQQPGGIDLDRQNKLVFWVDGALRTVESIDYDGNNRKLLYRSSSNSLYGVTFFSSYLFVSNSSYGAPGVIKLNASNGEFTSFVPLLGPGRPRGLVMYNSSRQLPVITTTCPSLPAPSNGTRLGCPGNTTVYYGTICQFSCNNGYVGSGSQLRRCQETGNWSGIDFTCQRFYCEQFPIPVHGGIKTPCTRLPGHSCRLTCDRGYNLIGSAIRWCNSDGTWTGTQPRCYGSYYALDVPCNSRSPCILVASKEIIALDYNNATIYPIISNVSYAVAIDYHYSLGYIFWSDLGEGNIKRSNINGTDIKVLHNTTWRCYGLAVDWRSSQLYWTDWDARTISVSDLDGNNKRVLISSLDDPFGIVLDPERGLMFWMVRRGHITKSTLNGTQDVTLVTSLGLPLGIDLDRQKKLVFWVDHHFGTVESVDYDGNNKKVLYRSRNSLWGVTLFSSYLFVSKSSYGAPGVIKLNASNGTFTSVVPLLGPGRPRGLVAYDRSRQLPVNTSTCPALPAPSNGTRLGCPAGNAAMYYDTVCQFSCNNGYIGSGSQVRRCQETGTWSGQDFTCQTSVTCPTLSTPTNGVLLGCDTTEMLYDTVCRFSCESGSQASGSTARRCTDNGTWSGTDLVCTDPVMKINSTLVIKVTG